MGRLRRGREDSLRPRRFSLRRARPLNAGVRLPNIVQYPRGNARMKSASDGSLRFRGPAVAASNSAQSGVRAGEVSVLSGPGAGCVNRHRLAEHQVPRSRASSDRRRCGRPSSLFGWGSANGHGGVCRWGRGQAERSAHSHSRLAPCPGTTAVRQPNNRIERRMIHKLPSSSVSACGAHAER